MDDIIENKQRREKKIKFMMERIFDCYCEHGLRDTNMKQLAAACGTTVASMYQYFENQDDMIIKSTAYCMQKVEDDFMAQAPDALADIPRFLAQIPYWTAERHGAKYRFMYQVYTTPKFLDYGKAFFEGVTQRYTDYAKVLEPKLGIPWQTIQPMIFIFVRAVVHYALFEEEEYLKPQISLLQQMIQAVKADGSGIPAD